MSSRMRAPNQPLCQTVGKKEAARRPDQNSENWVHNARARVHAGLHVQGPWRRIRTVSDRGSTGSLHRTVNAGRSSTSSFLSGP